MSELVPLSKLISALNTATKGSKTGAFFITTEDQHSAMITLNKGKITGLKFRTTRGYQAAAELAKCNQLKFQTAAEPTELPGEGEVDSAAVINVLQTGDVNAAPSQGAGGGGGGGGGASAKVDLDALRNRYIAAIGPIAGALFDEAVEELGDALQTNEGVEQLIRKLAQQIDDQAEADRFVQDARPRT